jgi:hypothetical protein
MTTRKTEAVVYYPPKEGCPFLAVIISDGRLLAWPKNQYAIGRSRKSGWPRQRDELNMPPGCGTSNEFKKAVWAGRLPF